MKLAVGLYEHLVNELIDEGISEAARENLRAEVRELDAGDSHGYIAQYLATYIRKAFASGSRPAEPTNSTRKQSSCTLG